MGHSTPVADEFDGWIPYRLSPDCKGLDWCFTGDLPFTDPFFGDTITRAFRRPYSLAFQRRTSLDEARALCSRSELLPPAGFIFHMSRCGSTLVSRTLAACPNLLVLSEPPVFDAAVRKSASDEDVRIASLALSRKRSAIQSQLIVKMDCWSVLWIERIRRIFPDVPCLFLSRNPIEVLVSQLTRPSAWTLPGVLPSEIFGIDSREATRISRAEFCARALGAITARAAQAQRLGVLQIIDYSELPAAIWGDVATAFSLDLAGSEASMKAVSQVDSKDPSKSFEFDSREKQSRASGEICELASRWIVPAYENLTRR